MLYPAPPQVEKLRHVNRVKVQPGESLALADEVKPLIVPADYKTGISLTEKYRGDALADVFGQDESVAVLKAFASRPYPAAFLLAGDSGTGKSMAGRALANELGCDINKGEWGGYRTIASGEQSVANVRELLSQLWMVPPLGSGWKVCLINEADGMHPTVEKVWLDALENIPPHCVIVFTTNNLATMSDRFRDRCQELHFQSTDSSTSRDAVSKLVRKVCAGELGRADAIRPESLKSVVRDGAVSFRRVIQELSKTIQSARVQ